MSHSPGPWRVKYWQGSDGHGFASIMAANNDHLVTIHTPEDTAFIRAVPSLYSLALDVVATSDHNTPGWLVAKAQSIVREIDEGTREKQE